MTLQKSAENKKAKPKRRNLHLVHRIDKRNTGDMVCNSGNYYKFTGFNVIKHDISRPNFQKIRKNDVVILSGGGLINCTNGWNKNINRLLNKCKNVFGWGIGFNAHPGQVHPTKIQFNKFKILGIRDYFPNYDSNIEYLPCSSCNLKQLNSKYKIKRKVGIVEHHHFKIGLNGYDKINNSQNINKIIRFIGESDVVITNTYHCLYFSLLLNKKVILHSSFSEKFNNLKQKFVWYSGDLTKDIELASKMDYSGYKTECKKINNAFYNKIKKSIRQN